MRRFIAILLMLTAFSGHAANVLSGKPLSTDSYIAIYTCAPGSRLYSQFGHSAIGVVDSRQNLNVVFNYGTFSFKEPHFYLKFCAGKLMYRLSVQSFPHFMYEYQSENRQVVEQRLNLTLEQRQHLFNMLCENYEPENRHYQYDFFFDNCATRILDMLYAAFGEHWTCSRADSSLLPTMRDCIHPYLDSTLWTRAGIDLVLGSVTDKPATMRQQAFLPDELCNYIALCKIDTLPAVLQTRAIISGGSQHRKTPAVLSPMTVSIVLLVVVLLLTFGKTSRATRVVDYLLFGIAGLFGLIVALLWFATEHGSTVGNLNILWASPLYLIYLFVIDRKARKWHMWLMLLLIASNLIMLTGFYLPQYFNPCFYFISLTLTIRLTANVLFNYRQFNSQAEPAAPVNVKASFQAD